jgi:uncharacterized protein (TIGR02217 family)
MFIDTYPPESIMKFGFVSTPQFSTNITAVASGAEKRNQNWANPLHTYAAPEAVECHEHLVALHNMWMTTRGPLHSFAFRDPLDFGSRNLPAPGVEPTIGATDQVLGIGDGKRREFQLVRSYAFGNQTYRRTIYHPVVDTVVVAMNALPPSTANPALPGGPYTWTVDRKTGVVTFNKPVNTGVIVTAGFLFDVEVRFERDDSYDGIVRSYRVSGHADLVFQEVRPC